MKYKNISRIPRTVHGVVFNSGEIKDVPHVIHDPKFVRVIDKAPVAAKAAKPVTKKADPAKAEPDTVEAKKGEAESKPTIKNNNKQEVTPNGSDSDQ